MLAVHPAESLRTAGACAISATSGNVRFCGGIFRVLPWRMLFAFERGQLIVDASAHEVRYRLSLGQMAITILLMMTWIGATAWPAMKYSLSVPLLLAMGWLWLFFSNLWFGVRRFEEFLRRAVDSAGART